MNKFKSFLSENIVLLDGGMGTLLQARGLAAGEFPERWNLSHPDVLTAIHRDYYDAGSHVVNTNTFGASSLKFDDEELETIIRAAIENARRAAAESQTAHPKWVALDVGPTGRMLKPYGDLDFEEAVSIFAVLDCPRRIGLSLNESLLMSPTKSVTAIIGLYPSVSL